MNLARLGSIPPRKSPQGFGAGDKNLTHGHADGNIGGSDMPAVGLVHTASELVLPVPWVLVGRCHGHANRRHAARVAELLRGAPGICVACA